MCLCRRWVDEEKLSLFGSKSLNELVPEMFDKLDEESTKRFVLIGPEPLKPVQVRHLGVSNSINT